MAITKRAPNTIFLGGGGIPGGEGGCNYVNNIKANATIKPGMLIEYENVGGEPRWKPHASSAGTFAAAAFALDMPFLNKGVEDTYASGDLVLAGIMQKGSTVWAIVPSGQNIVPGDKLESNGDGKLKEGTTYPVGISLDNLGAVTADTRCRVEVI